MQRVFVADGLALWRQVEEPLSAAAPAEARIAIAHIGEPGALRQFRRPYLRLFRCQRTHSACLRTNPRVVSIPGQRHVQLFRPLFDKLGKMRVAQQMARSDVLFALPCGFNGAFPFFGLDLAAGEPR